jgi:hypothetical protein
MLTRSLTVDGQHASEAEWLRQRMNADGEPTEIHDYLQLLAVTGNVNLYVKALKADHCQYF